MTTKIEHIIDQSTNHVLTKFHSSKWTGFFLTGVLSDPIIADKTGYNSAVTSKTLLEFQRREIPIQTTPNLIIFSVNINQYHIVLLR